METKGLAFRSILLAGKLQNSHHDILNIDNVQTANMTDRQVHLRISAG